MNINPRILFFGSNEDSVTVLNSLFEAKFNIIAVVTQPPKPYGRKKVITPTPTENWAIDHKITVVHFKSNLEKPWIYEDEASVINTLSTFSPDLLISASYGLKIPTETINSAKYGGLNVHPSLLPRFRGADPIPWTILSGDAQAGVTIVTLTEKMDQGKIIAQQKIALDQKTTHIPLRTELFKLGCQLLLSSLEDYLDGTNKGNIQNQLEACTARRMKKIDGFVPWDFVLAVINGNNKPSLLQDLALYKNLLQSETHNSLLTTQNPQLTTPTPAVFLDRMLRALSPWPGVYTKIEIKGEEKMLKILSGHLEELADDYIFVIDQVQLEGKTPVSFDQFSKAYNI